MSIKTEQDYVTVKIVDAFFGPSKFTDDNGKMNNRGETIAIMGDVCCVVETEDGQRDIWRGEISNRMGPLGSTIADKYQSDLTLKTLQGIGFNVQTLPDLFGQFSQGKDGETVIPNLIGLTADAKIKKSEKDGKVFYNVQTLYGKKKEEKFSFTQFQQMIAAQQQPSAPVPPAPQMQQAPTGYYPPPAPQMQQPAAPAPAPAQANPYAAFNQQPAAPAMYNPYAMPQK